MRKRLISLFLLAACCYSLHAQDTAQQIIRGRFNSVLQQKKPYVILISVDGLRYDMARKFGAKNLLRLARTGVTTDYMLSSFPSLTFPNHYTIVTGLYPSHHGLVSNRFYNEDRTANFSMHDGARVAEAVWYGGTPLWVLAEKQQMLTASYFWVGSEAAIGRTYPSYYYKYNEKRRISERIATVKDWLQLPDEKRPHLITFYFPDVDHAAHDYGPDAVETGNAVRFVDNSIGKLVATVDSLGLPVNYIVVSDHGLARIDDRFVIRKPAAVDTAQFFISTEGALVHLYAKPATDIKKVFNKLKAAAKNYDVYLREEMPAKWHYGKTDDRFGRIGDIILLARPPAYFQFGKGTSKDKGKHGFAPEIKEMRASFFAWGPAFKQLKMPPFENVHIYPLVAKILGLEYTFSIDGRMEVLQEVLKDRK